MTTDGHEGRGGLIRVAIVDDLGLIAEALVAQLSDKRHGIHPVLSASSWSELLSHEEFPTDVTVLDLGLGDAIPIDTKVRTLTAAGSRVVIMSRHAHSSSIDKALRSGALGFVSKTARTHELVAAIRAASVGQRYKNTLAPTATAKGPSLGERELRAIELYASGMSIKEVAIEMDATEETVKSYVKRARRKYRDAGIDLGTKIRLRSHALRVGWLDHE